MRTNEQERLEQNIRQLEIILNLMAALKRVAIVGQKVAEGKMSDETGWEAICIIVEEVAQDIPEVR